MNFSAIAGVIFCKFDTGSVCQIFGSGINCCHKDNTFFLHLPYIVAVKRFFLCSNSADIDGWRFPNFLRIQRMWSCKCHCLMVPWVLLKGPDSEVSFFGKKLEMEDFNCQMPYTPVI